MKKDLTDEEFDRMLDEHFSNDNSIRRGITKKQQFDDPLYKQNNISNLREISKTRIETSNWLDNQKKKWQDPEFIEHFQKTVETRSNQELWKQNQKVGYEKRKNNPEWQKKQDQWHKNKSNDPEYIKLMKETNRRTSNDPNWIIKTCRPVISPYGIFPKSKLAFECYQAEHGGNEGSNRNRLRRMLKDPNNKEWQYITFEEYTRLTGKEI